MPSLRELQIGFAAALFDDDGARPPFATVPDALVVERMAVYRRALFANYRNALGASFPVVSKLVGAATSGDLNVYGDAFAAFLETYPHAAGLPYLADVARLEWAQDEANRAADADHLPERVLAALALVAPERLPATRLPLAPSCRLVASRFPILRIWQANQEGYGDARVTFDETADMLLIRRELAGVTIERVASAEFAWLEALASGAPLGAALESAQDTGVPFDLATALRSRIGDGTIAGVSTS